MSKKRAPSRSTKPKKSDPIATAEPIEVGQLAVWTHPSLLKQTRARVLLIHGLSEHSGRHLNTVFALNGAGYEVVRFDLRGSGRSGGKRMWIERFEDYVDDASEVYQWLCRSLEPKPLYLLGHSLGGAVATYFADTYQNVLKGLILNAPAFRAGVGISVAKITVGKLLSRWSPFLRIPNNPGSVGISRDPKVIEAYKSDSLACHFTTLRQGTEILRAMEGMPDRCEKIRLPVLLTHGSDDRVVRLDGSFDLLKHLAGHDKILHIIPAAYHELHNDLDRDEYFHTLTHWLDQHTS